MGRKAAKPPQIADPGVRERLEKAAAAAGLSVEQLADLVFESGVVPTPSSDGATVRYTLLDLGKRLWSTVQATPRSERAAWFEQLVPTQRTALIVALREQGYRSEVIARDFGISTMDVARTWNAYASELGSQVVGIRLDTIAGQVQLAAERAQQMAMEAGDHRGYWAVEKDRVAVLQSIGIVDQAIRRVEVKHKIDDEQRAEIERIAELRKKQDRRKVEILELDRKDQGGDELPTELQDDDDE